VALTPGGMGALNPVAAAPSDSENL